MNQNESFTVFTPTYNRAHTLHRVFESLQKQVFRDFEWLIVDDGSTDNTAAVVANFQKQANFPIRYIFQENQGKHIAFNRGVAAAHHSFFLTLDSDDGCLPEALATFKKNWDEIPPSVREQFCGVNGRCQRQTGELVGKKPIPNGLLDVHSLDLAYRYGIQYELWGFTRTDILKKYPFPEHIKNAYVPETVVWTQIGKAYKTRFLNKVLRIYYTDDTHETITKNIQPDRQRNFLGYVMHYQQVLNEQLQYFWSSPISFIKAAIQYSRFSFRSKISPFSQFSAVKTRSGRLLWACVLPVAFAFFCIDSLKSK